MEGLPSGASMTKTHILNRHGGASEWSQYDAAQHLQQCGYELFWIGSQAWMQVSVSLARSFSLAVALLLSLFVCASLSVSRETERYI